MPVRQWKVFCWENPLIFDVAMNMDGISELNDLAGGVTVTLEDDFLLHRPCK